MVNRPKQIGTAAETAVARAAQRLGFPNADRLTMRGANDRGDIGLCPGVIVEVKGGEAAKTASDLTIDDWLRETVREVGHAGADFGFLVVQRRGVGAPNADRWWAWWRLGWLERLRGHDVRGWVPGTPVRMQLGEALDLLRHAGYGVPIDRDTTSDAALAELRERLTGRSA